MSDEIIKADVLRSAIIKFKEVLTGRQRFLVGCLVDNPSCVMNLKNSFAQAPQDSALDEFLYLSNIAIPLPDNGELFGLFNINSVSKDKSGDLSFSWRWNLLVPASMAADIFAAQ